VIPDYQKAISEISRVLTAGGIFACTTPALGISKKFDTVWGKKSDKHGFHSFTKDDIKKACFSSRLDYKCFDTNGEVLYFTALKEK
jgi:ubiquinone/menaquinone biosynthesis C-methylase UbiE